jgi:WD40 repeat protein
MAKLFVSYSRKDSVAARKLIESFKSLGNEVWVDWESIPPAVDWLEQIFRGIEEADAFIFMVSPDSIISEVCKVEIGRAVQNNKRIIPVVLRDVKPQDTIENIRKLNWTFLRETDNLDEGLAKVKTAIELDLDWLEEHNRLQVRALEWHRKKDVSLLLRGRDLRNAIQMVETYTSKDPIPTELQRKYIEFSRRTERNRTIAWIATAVALVALAILSYTAIRESRIAQANAVTAKANEVIAVEQREEALKQKKLAEDYAALAETNRLKAVQNAQDALQQKLIAENNALLAEAQRSAARAQIYQTRTGSLYTSTLLALDSWEKSPSDEAEQILRKNISLLPFPVAQVHQNGSITALEMSPDGTAFLTASSDGNTCVRNLKDGKELFCASSSKSVHDAIFIQGGKSIAIANDAGQVQILNAQDGSVVREIEAGSSVQDLDVGPNGNDLAIARANGNITILNIANLKDKGYNIQIGGTLTAADLSPNGRWYAAGSSTGTVTVWNLNSTTIYSAGRHKGAVLSIQFGPNSRFVISGGADNYAVGLDTQTGQEVFRLLHSDAVEKIDFAPGGSWFATASDDGRARVWNLSTAQEDLTMLQDSAITNIQVSSDGKWISTTGDDNTVRVWSAYTGVEMFQIPLETAGVALTFSNDNQRLVSGDANGNIDIWDISGMTTPTHYIQFDALTWISKFTASGNTLIASDANHVWLLNPRELSSPQSRPPGNSSFDFKNDIYDLVVSPDSQWIGISTYANEYIIYNLKTRIPVRVSPSGDAYALAFSADSSKFITGATDGMVQTWDVKTGKLISSFKAGDSILSIGTGPKGIALGANDKIIILDAKAGQKITEWDAPGKNQYVAFNADGSLLASANPSGQIEIWQQTDGKYELQKTITREQPYSLTFDPQSNLLAVGTTSNVYLIDAASGEELERIPHKGIVYSVSFSPDGKTLATASLKVIQLWDISKLQATKTEDIVQAACSRLINNFSLSEWQVLFGADLSYVQLCKNLPIPE